MALLDVNWHLNYNTKVETSLRSLDCWRFYCKNINMNIPLFYYTAVVPIIILLSLIVCLVLH